MRMECDERVAAANEVEYLTPFGVGPYAKLQAIVAIAYHDEVEPWQIGRAAWLAWGEKKGSGFSPGTTTDEAKRRANWASCASKARKKWNLNPLIDQLERFRTDGGEPESVSWKQMMARCDHLIIHGSATESLRAIELKTKLTGKQDAPTAAEVVKPLIAEVGVERTLRGLKELGLVNLIHGAAELLKDYDNGKSGPDAGRAGDDAGNFEGGRSCRTGHDATAEMDERFGNVDGAGTGKRRDDCRGVGERIGPLEATA